MTTLRLMTYNVRGLKDDVPMLHRIIKAADPDVLCLQEMPRHPFSDHRISAFAEAVGMLWAGGVRHRMSTTLLTAPRVSLHEGGHVLYGVPRPQEPRGYAWARISKPGVRELNVVSTHMSLYGSLRGGHAEKLLADEHFTPDLPLIVAGDFNELDNGPAGKVLKRRLLDAGPRVNTFPADNPQKRIDFIYASADTALAGVSLSFSDSDYGKATDHRPLVVDVTVKSA